jgi:heme-degrading monooxygenase HmoA
MATLLVRHKVKDYSKWKAVYDGFDSFRKENGVRGARVLRNTSKPNELVVLHEFDDMKKARKFAKSKELKEAMQRGGVADSPDVYFLHQVESTHI